jgi:hypothetical protein
VAQKPGPWAKGLGALRLVGVGLGYWAAGPGQNIGERWPGSRLGNRVNNQMDRRAIAQGFIGGGRQGNGIPGRKRGRDALTERVKRGRSAIGCTLFPFWWLSRVGQNRPGLEVD